MSQTEWKERTDSLKLFSDFYMQAVVFARPHSYTHHSRRCSQKGKPKEDGEDDSHDRSENGGWGWEQIVTSLTVTPTYPDFEFLPHYSH